MGDIFFILAVVACLAVVGVLALGLGGFAGGGAFNKKNKLMRYRIAAQFVAVIFIVVFVYFRNQGG